MPLEGLWTVFGPETTAGRQLRSIFGSAHFQTTQTKIIYPKLRPRPAGVQPVPPAPCVKRPDIQYPKFTKSRGKPRNNPVRSSRRSLDAIRESQAGATALAQPPVVCPQDMSGEKRKLQEAFQFCSKKIPERRNNSNGILNPGDIRLPEVVKSWNTVTKH